MYGSKLSTIWYSMEKFSSSTLAFYFFLGTKGRNKGEFTNLQGVAASSTGRILIADSNNQCVQVQLTLTASKTICRFLDKIKS